MLDLEGDSHLKARSESLPLPLLPTCAGMIAAAITAFFVSELPRVRLLDLASLLFSALGRAQAVFLACVVTASAVSILESADHRLPSLPRVASFSIPAIWLAAIAILIREHSAWAMLAAACFAAHLTYTIAANRQDSAVEAADDLSVGPCFSLIESSAEFRRQAAMVLTALCAQIALVAGFTGYTVASVLVAGVCSAVSVDSMANRLALDPAYEISQQFRLRSYAAAVLAMIFMAAALAPYLQIPFGRGGYGVLATRHPRHRLTGGRNREPQKGWPVAGSVLSTEDSHSGIILWAPEQEHTRLVAPVPLIGANSRKSDRSADPLVIPFDGVYWFYKSPDTSPPKTSREAHGSPELFDIHSTDRRPLSMEAHENLGSFFDLNCCSRIEVAIRNRDRYPESVLIELVLVDSTAPGKPSQSLGKIMVRSTPAWDIYAQRVQTSETLDFTIPTRHAISEFDEVRIVFRLDQARADAGAKIGIDRFVLVPRGL